MSNSPVECLTTVTSSIHTPNISIDLWLFPHDLNSSVRSRLSAGTKCACSFIVWRSRCSQKFTGAIERTRMHPSLTKMLAPRSETVERSVKLIFMFYRQSKQPISLTAIINHKCLKCNRKEENSDAYQLQF